MTNLKKDEKERYIDRQILMVREMNVLTKRESRFDGGGGMPVNSLTGDR
jgi:hypothetical protein